MFTNSVIHKRVRRYLSQQLIGYRKGDNGQIVQSVLQNEVEFEDGSIMTCYSIKSISGRDDLGDLYTEKPDIDLPPSTKK